MYAGIVLYVIATWWLATGAIFVLGRLPRRTFRWSVAGATALLVVALFGLYFTAGAVTPAAAAAGFACAVLVWAWLETTFLLGAITGPRRQACAAGCQGWRHAWHAFEAVAWHELATVAAVVLVGALSWHAANPYGLWSILLLWAMRVSAKLNLHLGVPNTGVAMLPAHLRYLEGFFRQRRLNPLFPVSVTLSAALSAWLIRAAWLARETEFEGSGLTLLATLATLGLLEHLMLLLPMPADTLWHWSRRSQHAASAAVAKPLCGATAPVRGS